MSLWDNLPDTITIKRNQPVAGTTKRRLATVASGVKCWIQPSNNEVAASYGMAVGNSFMMFLLTADIQDGDQITDQRGFKYGVRGVMHLPYGTRPHYEIVIEKEVK